MKFGALLNRSAIPADVPHINLRRAGLVAPSTPTVTDWTCTPAPDGDLAGNDKVGDCVPVGMFRWAQTAIGRRYNRAEPLVTDDVLALYSRLTGYNGTPATDQGSDPNAAMKAWATNADLFQFAGENWPILWTRVTPTMLAEVGEAMTQTPLLAMVSLPAADADQPDNWGNAPGTGPAWAGTEGHCMLMVRNGSDYWTMRTWGMDVPWHLARIAYVQDLFAPLEASRTDFTRLGLDYLAVAAP